MRQIVCPRQEPSASEPAHRSLFVVSMHLHSVQVVGLTPRFSLIPEYRSSKFHAPSNASFPCLSRQDGRLPVERMLRQVAERDRVCHKDRLDWPCLVENKD